MRQKYKNHFDPNRRQFINSFLPMCAFSCLNIQNIEASINNKNDHQDIPFEERIKTPIDKDYCKTYEKAWKWRYNYFIRSMEFFANEIGREKVIELLKKQNDSILLNDNSDKSANTFDKWVETLKFKIHNGYREMLESQIIEETGTAIELRASKCLWAQTFLNKNAGDLGYAFICYGDSPKATYFNPKLKLHFTKTLMQGDDCCNHRYTWHE